MDGEALHIVKRTLNAHILGVPQKFHSMNT